MAEKLIGIFFFLETNLSLLKLISILSFYFNSLSIWAYNLSILMFSYYSIPVYDIYCSDE
jgi:hypothetical protein